MPAHSASSLEFAHRSSVRRGDGVFARVPAAGCLSTTARPKSSFSWRWLWLLLARSRRLFLSNARSSPHISRVYPSECPRRERCLVFGANPSARWFPLRAICVRLLAPDAGVLLVHWTVEVLRLTDGNGSVQPILTADEVAASLKISKRTRYRFARQRIIPAAGASMEKR